MLEKSSFASIAAGLMMDFAKSTGLSPTSRNPRRYLWTDAFAVCNFLALYQTMQAGKYLELAASLIDQVHNVLGRRRGDNPQRGWLSGLSEEEGAKHPTKGGLRIGKLLDERAENEMFDGDLEWERDGQYYHYLTKWMHALSRAASVAGDGSYLQWALELAKAVHPRFVYDAAGDYRKKMYWKKSIDLSRPLVPSMGEHDPLDGLVTYLELQAAISRDPDLSAQKDLNVEIKDMFEMCGSRSWMTDDPLGMGEILGFIFKLAQLIAKREAPSDYHQLLISLVDSSLVSMRYFQRRNPLMQTARYRLAFRELGLSIGLHAVERLRPIIGGIVEDPNTKLPLHAKVESLMTYVPIANRIEQFWLDEGNKKDDSWTAHSDINTVMLAASLLPDGYLSI